MTRRRFSERQVIATLIYQGVPMVCYRTGEKITLENVMRLEREHLHEISLGGPDTPDNCRYSLKEAHAVITNGTKATTAGSSKHKVAHADRIHDKGRFGPKSDQEHSGQPVETKPKRRLQGGRPLRGPDSRSGWPGSENWKRKVGGKTVPRVQK